MVEIALLQNLGTFQCDFCSFWEIRVKLHKTGKILPEIQHRLPCRSLDDFLHFQFFHSQHRKAQTIHQVALFQILRALVLLRALQYRCWFPRIFLPLPEQFIENLTVIDSRVFDQRPLVLPAFVCADYFFGTILVFDMQLRDRRHAVSIIIFL